jgi:hypothetical protein
MKTKTIFTLFAVTAVTLFTGASVAQQYGNRLAIHEHDISSQLVETGKLSNQEQEALQFMIEEEKLARDLYAAFEEKWGRSSFGSITASEQNHINEITAVLEFYGLSADAAEAGKFANRDLQKLYDDLLAKGSVSLTEALKAAALVEDVDISDLKEYLSQTENANLQLVFNNLLRGSENHLRAFARQLSRVGEEYAPQHISATDYEAIISGNTFDRGGYRYTQADSLSMRRFADDSTHFYGRRGMQGNRSAMMPGMQGRMGVIGRQGQMTPRAGSQGMQGMPGRKGMQNYNRNALPYRQQEMDGRGFRRNDGYDNYQYNMQRNRNNVPVPAPENRLFRNQNI